METSGLGRPPDPTATPDRWLVDAVHELRALGFFAGLEGADAGVAAELLADLRAEWGRDPAPNEHLDELLLVRFDEGRIWWEDTEADVALGSDAYVEALRGWAKISRGSFEPQGIREEWAGEDGPLAVFLTLRGTVHRLVPRHLGDYLDLDLLRQVDQLAADARYRLMMHVPFDQTALVVAVDGRERRRLEERGWSFAGPTGFAAGPTGSEHARG